MIAHGSSSSQQYIPADRQRDTNEDRSRDSKKDDGSQSLLKVDVLTDSRDTGVVNDVESSAVVSPQILIPAAGFLSRSKRNENKGNIINGNDPVAEPVNAILDASNGFVSKSRRDKLDSTLEESAKVVCSAIEPTQILTVESDQCDPPTEKRTSDVAPNEIATE